MANNFIDIPKMRMFCHKVLPLVYDDSLSYYEVLCKVVFKLNEVISNIEKLPDYIAELISDERLREILSTLLDKLQEQIASANEGTSETATADRNIGDLVWLNGYLFRITRQINAGDRYVNGSNCEAITVEDLFNEAITTIAPFIETNDSVASRDLTVGELVWWRNKLYEVTSPIAESEGYAGRVRLVTIEMLLYNEKTARTNADTALGARIDNEITARQEADTALGTRIDNEITARQDADTALSTALGARIDNEVTARQDADTALGARIDNEVTARQDADTALANRFYYVTPQDFGAVGDGVTDDSAAFVEAFTHNNVHIPEGSYKITERLFISSDVTITADAGATLVCSFTDTSLIKVTGQNVVIRDLTMTGINDPENGSEYNHAIYLAEPTGVVIENCTIDSFTGDGIYLGADGGSHPQHTKILDCKINNCGRNGISIIQNGDFLIDGCSIFNTSGLDPQKAFDIEPNNDDSIIIGSITNCVTSGNTNGFMQIYINHTISAFNVVIDSCISAEDSNRTTGRPNISFRNDVAGTQGSLTISNMTMSKCRNTALSITGTSVYFPITADITAYNMLSTYGVEYWARGDSGATQGYCNINFRSIAPSSFYTTLVKTSGTSNIANLILNYEGTKTPTHEANDNHSVILRWLLKDYVVDGTLTSAGVITSTGNLTATKTSTGVYVISGVDHVKSVTANVTGSTAGFCTATIASDSVTIRTYSASGVLTDLPSSFSIHVAQTPSGWVHSPIMINTYNI